MVVDFILSIMLHTTGRVQECAMTRFRQCPLQCMYALDDQSLDTNIFTAHVAGTIIPLAPSPAIPP